MINGNLLIKSIFSIKWRKNNLIVLNRGGKELIITPPEGIEYKLLNLLTILISKHNPFIALIVNGLITMTKHPHSFTPINLFSNFVDLIILLLILNNDPNVLTWVLTLDLFDGFLEIS